ncbi:MAG: hypothetical protein AAFO73_07530, partial [Pseudomonadota bacterium]
MGDIASTAGPEAAPSRAAPVAPIDRLYPYGEMVLAAVVRRWLTSLVLAFTLVAVLVTASMALLRPSLDWDALAYTALALEQPGDSAEALHGKAYATVKSLVSETRFKTLTEDDEYRRHQIQSASAFASMMPMYRVKIGYVEALRLLQPHIGVLRAAHVLNITALLLLMAAAIWWLDRNKALLAAPLVFLVYLSLQGREVLDGILTDLPAAGLTVAALAAFAARKPFLTAVFLLVAITVRPDTILL